MRGGSAGVNLHRARATNQSQTHRAELLGFLEERRAHAALEAERLGAAAVESDAGDVVLDDLHGLDGEVRGGAAELEDEARFLERVAVKDGAAVLAERDDAGAGCERDGGEGEGEPGATEETTSGPAGTGASAEKG